MIKLKDLLNEGKYTVYFDVGSPGLMSKTVSARNEKEAAKQVASGLKGGAKLIKKVVKEGTGLTYKKGKTVKVKHKTSGKSIVIIDKPNVRREYEKIGFFAEGSCGYGIDGKVGKKPAGPHLLKKKKKILKSRVHEAPGKSGKDEYVGTARVKVEPGTYKGQRVNFHDVSMYRDHKKPYHYYLTIRLAHSDGKKVDMVISTGTHILKKAGKWAQGFIKRRVGGTGKERFQ